MVVTLHLYGVGPAGVPGAVLRMGLDRRPLARTPGLNFWKLLGTGRGVTFTPSDADPRRWALFGVWDDAAALAAFERSSPVARGWRALAEERCRIDLHPLRSKGRWAGREPFGAPKDTGWAGPVAAVTRARIRPAANRTFWRAVPPVTTDLHDAPGLVFSIGIGEAPIGLQGTFSIWRDAPALRAFAYRGTAHRSVIDRTATERWYAEELFARFGVLQVTGTVAGRDPSQ